MPKRCIAYGCNRSSEDGYSLHHFPKNSSRRAKWSRNVGFTRINWSGPTDHSVLCSLHFTKDCYEQSCILAEDVGAPPKRRVLKETAIPTLFPKAQHLSTGSMSWALESIHSQELHAMMGIIDTSQSRSVVAKRKRAQVCIVMHTIIYVTIIV